MFVLKGCPICYGKYHETRCPHIIPCGHVFCRSCLDTLSQHSSNCPVCRSTFTGKGIQKIAGLEFEKPSKWENAVWRQLEHGSKPENFEYRQAIVSANSVESLQEAGVSECAQLAFGIMERLVQVEGIQIKTEKRNAKLKARLDAANESTQVLSEHVVALEGQLQKSKLYNHSQSSQPTGATSGHTARHSGGQTKTTGEGARHNAGTGIRSTATKSSQSVRPATSYGSPLETAWSQFLAKAIYTPGFDNRGSLVEPENSSRRANTDRRKLRDSAIY